MQALNVAKEAVDSLDSAQGCGPCGIFSGLLSRFANAKGHGQSLMAATKGLAKARRNFCESILTRRALSDLVCSVLDDTCDKQEGDIMLTLTRDTGTTALFFNPVRWAAGTARPAMPENQKCMGFRQTSKTKCPNNATTSYVVLSKTYSDDPNLVIPEIPGADCKVLHLCGHHSMANVGFVNNMGTAVQLLP